MGLIVFIINIGLSLLIGLLFTPFEPKAIIWYISATISLATVFVSMYICGFVLCLEEASIGIAMSFSLFLCPVATIGFPLYIRHIFRKRVKN